MPLRPPTPSVRTLEILTIRQGGTASGSPADAVRSKRKVPFSVQAQNESFSFSPYPALLIVFAMSSFTGRHPKDMAHNTLSEYWHSHTQDTDSFHKPRQKKLSVYCVSVKNIPVCFGITLHIVISYNSGGSKSTCHFSDGILRAMPFGRRPVKDDMAQTGKKQGQGRRQSIRPVLAHRARLFA